MMLSRAALFAIALILPGAALAQDAADLVVRMNRVENQIRAMSGQIEQLQFENRQLKEQLRKFQEDVEFRFSERSGVKPAPGPETTPRRRSDAFDPAAQPEAPGRPQPLGTTTPSSARGVVEAPAASGGTPPLDINTLAQQGLPTAARNASPPASEARQSFDAAYGLYQQKQYEQAEGGFRQFVAANPRNRLTPDALYWLGETYAQRGRWREAAEQFLKVTTDHANASKAPDAMLRLGVSLNALGAKDQACSTFAALEGKYPNASNAVKQGVARERGRVKC